MPYRTDWVEPEVFMEHRGIKIYHTYKDNDEENGPLSFWFTVDVDCEEDQCSCESAKCRNVFDVRDLDKSGNDRQPNAESITQIIARAIDDGRLVAHKLTERTRSPCGGLHCAPNTGDASECCASAPKREPSHVATAGRRSGRRCLSPF